LSEFSLILITRQRVNYQQKKGIKEAELGGGKTCSKWEMAGSPAKVRDGIIGPSKAYYTSYPLMVESITATELMKPLPGKNESNPLNKE
jgi:hypothetical protein